MSILNDRNYKKYAIRKPKNIDDESNKLIFGQENLLWRKLKDNEKLIKIIFTIFFISSVANAEIVSKIIIEGNKRVSDETIKIYGDIDLNKDYSDLDLDKVLKNLYETEFFEDVNLELKNNTLTINLKDTDSKSTNYYWWKKHEI